MNGRHEVLLEKTEGQIKRLLQGAIFHAEDLATPDPDITLSNINDHNEQIGQHIKAAKLVLDKFGEQI